MWYGHTRHKLLTQVMPSLKPVNFNNFLSVNNTLEEGLLEHDGVTTLH